VILFLATHCLLCRPIFIVHTSIQIERTGLEMYGTTGFNEDSTRHAMYTRTQQSAAFVKPSLHCESNKCYIIWVCVCSHRYPACNAHAPYCYLWPVLFYIIFPHFINATILETGHNMCFDFLDKFFWNISRSKKNSVKIVYWCSSFLSDFNGNWIFSTDFRKKNSNV